jgi:hypothetical protein
MMNQAGRETFSGPHAAKFRGTYLFILGGFNCEGSGEKGG